MRFKCRDPAATTCGAALSLVTTAEQCQLPARCRAEDGYRERCCGCFKQLYAFCIHICEQVFRVRSFVSKE